MNSGFLKVAAVSPRVTVGGIKQNLENAIQELHAAERDGIKLLVFPELYLSAYTCGDLFLQRTLQENCKKVLLTLCDKTKGSDMVVCVGVPLVWKARLYNCAAVLQNGQILAVIPKTYLPNYNEYYEKRWFASGDQMYLPERSCL